MALVPAGDLLFLSRDAFRPPPKLKVSEWSNQFRYLSAEDSAEPGRYMIERTPFLREILDSVIEPTIRETWVMKSAQVGYSQALNNILGYFVHQRPSPMMMLQPTLEMSEAFSKDRISPMVRDSPVLRERIDDGSRKGGNTILHKKFPGGHITLAGANSPASLASRPIKVVLVDEPDRYPVSAGAEGDPIKLLQKRSTTFWDRAFIAGGTPTVKSMSRIEKGFRGGDQRYYHVPCPHCENLIALLWDQLCVDINNDEHYAEYKCQSCEAWINHAHKIGMIADIPMGGKAKWIASKPFRGIASYHISELYSPWVTWGEMADAYNAAKDDQEQLRVFTNTSLGESSEETPGERMEASALMSRRIDYHPQGIPNEIIAATFGCDTQDDRLELEVVGWAPGEESWSLDYRTLHGDTADPAVWQDLEEYLRTVAFTRIDGKVLRLHAGIIDSGGHRTDEVYKFCRGKARRKIYPGKGSSVRGKPILASLTRQKKARVMLAMIGTDTAKEQIYSRLAQIGYGPGRCHFPMSYDQRYFEMLTAEEKITEWRQGQPVEKWVRRKDGGGRLLRNEALDCRVYATAALQLITASQKFRWMPRVAKKEDTPKPEAPQEETQEPAQKVAKKAKKAAKKPTFQRNRRPSGKRWRVGVR